MQEKSKNLTNQKQQKFSATRIGIFHICLGNKQDKILTFLAVTLLFIDKL